MDAHGTDTKVNKTIKNMVLSDFLSTNIQNSNCHECTGSLRKQLHQFSIQII